MSKEKTADYLQKIMRYCARAERCRQDVLKKLDSYDAPTEEWESILEVLYEENYLNDERYVMAYANDKWKLAQWGRLKIQNGLFRKGFGESMIEKGLSIVEDEPYKFSMEEILSRKRETIHLEAPIDQMKKLMAFGQSRGIEEDIIWRWLEKEGLSF